MTNSGIVFLWIIGSIAGWFIVCLIIFNILDYFTELWRDKEVILKGSFDVKEYEKRVERDGNYSFGWPFLPIYFLSKGILYLVSLPFEIHKKKVLEKAAIQALKNKPTRIEQAPKLSPSELKVYYSGLVEGERLAREGKNFEKELAKHKLN